MTNAFRAGIAYFALVFALGFALGTLRVLVLAPKLGTVGAVLLELPVVLLAAWMMCRWLIRRLRVPADVTSRATMGASAFALLMIAELALSVGVFDTSARAHFGHYLTPHGAIGLAGQMVFGLFPLMQRG